MKSSKDQYSSIVKFLSAIGKGNNEHYDQFKRKMESGIAKSKKTRKKAALSEIQSREWFNLSSLKDKYTERRNLLGKKNKQKTGLIGMLIHQPPRRTNELAKLKFSSIDPIGRPTTSNYLYKDGDTFKMHLNVYKNKKVLGHKKIKIKNVLQDDIQDLSLSLRDQENVFGAKTKKTLNTYFKDIVDDQNVTIRTARNVYATDKLNKLTSGNISVNKIRELASDMGHSTKTLLRDYWKVDPKVKKKVKKLMEGDESDSDSS